MQLRLGAAGILAAWEAGAQRRPLDRSLAVLWAAGADDPADWPLTERDRRLLQIRAATFGPELPARATCGDCGAELEMELEANRLTRALEAAHAEAVEAGAGLRPLTSRDLAAVIDLPAEEVLPVLRDRLDDGGRTSTDARGEEHAENLNQTLDRRIERAARAAELHTQLDCPECGARWTETLDVGAHLWADVEAAAARLLDEVAELARAYGWSESEILSLSPARRRAYLERVSRP